MDSHQYNDTQKCAKLFFDTSISLPFWATYLSDSISSIDKNPCNPIHLLNTLKAEAISILTSHLLPIHVLSIHFFILFNSTCSFVFTTLQSGFSSSKSSSGWSCVTTASIGRFIAIKLDFTVLACVVCSMFCGSLYLHAVNWQRILCRSRSSSYRCLLHSHSQYYLVVRMSPLVRIFLECS